MARMDLSSIEINTPKNPPRLVVYGDHGIGKTTFATSAPAPIVLRTEKGLAGDPRAGVPDRGDVRRRARARSARSTTKTRRFRRLVVDTLDWLEPLVWTHTAHHNKANIEDFGYGKGYKSPTSTGGRSSTASTRSTNRRA
jgi:hypothetical protein